MADTIRGAEMLVRALKQAGVSRIFSLSGNHIMPVYDALFASGIDIVHTRHEAAAVHMADAWARLTGRMRRGAGDRRAGAHQCGGRAADRAGGRGAGAAAVGPCAAGRAGPRRVPGTGAGAHGRAAVQGGLHRELGGEPLPRMSRRRSRWRGRGGRGRCICRCRPTCSTRGSSRAALPEAAAFAPDADAALARDGGGDRRGHRRRRAAGDAWCRRRFARPAGRRLMAALRARASACRWCRWKARAGWATRRSAPMRRRWRRRTWSCCWARRSTSPCASAARRRIAATARFVVVEPEEAVLARAVESLGARIAITAMAGAAEAVAALTGGGLGRTATPPGPSGSARMSPIGPAAWAALAGTPEGPIHPATLCAGAAARSSMPGRIPCWSAMAARSGNGRRRC